MSWLSVRRTPSELRTGAVAFLWGPTRDFRPKYSSLVLFLSACPCISSAFLTHQEFPISRVRLCTCALSCLNWACFEAEFLSLSHAAYAQRFCSMSCISWSHWSKPVLVFPLSEPKCLFSWREKLHLWKKPMHLQLWQLVGLYQEDSLPAWLPIRLVHGSSPGSEHPVSSLCS